MKGRSGVSLVVLVGLAALAVQQAKAGSAVSIDDVGHMVFSYGHSKKVDERNVLELGRRMHGASVRLLAASDVAGYCAIASAPLRELRARQRYVYGVALGHSTPEEARRSAIEQCLKMGGINPKIKSEFRG